LPPLACSGERAREGSTHASEKLGSEKLADLSKRMVGIITLGDVSHSASGDLLSECVKSVSAHH
jgi:hypothetical protein